MAKLDGLHWWVKWAATAGIGLVSMFAGIISPNLQWAGLGLGVALLVLAAAGAGAHVTHAGWATPPGDPQSATSKDGLVKESVEVRIFVGSTITPPYLMAFYGEHTAIQADRLIEPFRGKWMRVSGAVGEIRSEIMLGPTVYLKGAADARLGDFKAVALLFQPSWTDRLSILRRDDAISVIGKISTVGANSILLVDCELEG